MIYIGPAGNSDSFYAENNKHTWQAPAWLRARGLNAFEYSFGRGVSLGEATGQAIAQAAHENHIEMSVHAPYYINLAVDDALRIDHTIRYFLQSAKGATLLGAKRIVFHPGSNKELTREKALALASHLLLQVIAILDDHGFGGIALCPETMGKINQLGDLQEVIALCQLDKRLVPALDFGHLHARGLGALQTKADFAAVLDALEEGIGFERASTMHVHFSRIEFTKAGEKKHWTFADTQFGPEFMPLAELIVERNYQPHLICESRGSIAEDAMSMKRDLENAAKAASVSLSFGSYESSL